MFYIVGTPLGNVEDMSFRGVKTLCVADVVLTEDTRTFQTFYKRVCALYKCKPEIDQKIIPFHDQNEFKQIPYILKILESGRTVALVSEAGMPLISDPGSLLIKHVISKGLPMTSVPSATAFTTGAALSGFDLEKLLFIGFLPKKDSEKKNLLKKLSEASKTLGGITIACYESSQRLGKTLRIIAEHSPTSRVAICRELTKMFEEVTIGKAVELQNVTPKGEITLIIRF